MPETNVIPVVWVGSEPDKSRKVLLFTFMI